MNSKLYVANTRCKNESAVIRGKIHMAMSFFSNNALCGAIITDNHCLNYIVFRGVYNLMKSISSKEHDYCNDCDIAMLNWMRDNSNTLW